MKKFYNKTKSKMTLQDKFDYIKNHNYYDILNSWNRLKTISNNVKVYNLPLTKQQQDKLYSILFDDDLQIYFWDRINYMIDNFLIENNNLEIYFNGRSGGYIVIKYKNSNKNIVNDWIIDNNSFDEFVENFENNFDFWSYREQRQTIKNIINSDFEIVKKFDVLCDKILNDVIFILNNSTIEEEEIEVVKKIKHIKG